MRRPPWLLCLAALGLTLTACNDKIDNSDEPQSTRTPTSEELIPFESTNPGDESSETEETEPDDTEASEASEAESDSDETDEESDDEVSSIDPMPGDTATFDTRPPEDPLCEAAQGVVDIEAEYEEALSDALLSSSDDSDELVDVLGKLPVEDLGEAYDELADEVPERLRRRVNNIKDFKVEHGEDLADVENFEELSELIAEIEADPDASKISKATLAVSEYTEDECGIRIAQGR